MNSPPMTPLYIGIEAGGTKIVCALGTSDGSILEKNILSTVHPDIALPLLSAKIKLWKSQFPISAIGLGLFGPFIHEPDSPAHGEIIGSPKIDWNGSNPLAFLREATQLPVMLSTDVNVAALGELHHGNGQGLTDFIYLTVGTGVGGGVIHGGHAFRGGTGLEMGHIRIPHTLQDFPGSCPYHGDCLEGIVSGPALEARWGTSPRFFPHDHPAWLQVAEALAHAMANWSFSLAPQRIILGGGVGSRPHLLSLIRPRLQTNLGNYGHYGHKNFRISDYLMPPALGENSGAIGSFVLACSSSATKPYPINL